MVCKILKFCDFKILFAVVTVSISVIWKNKSNTFSCSWVKTFNNTILIGKKIGKKFGKKKLVKKSVNKIGVFKISSENVIFTVCL